MTATNREEPMTNIPDDDLIRERHAIVRLPEATPDWHGGLTRWEVPIIGQRRPGEVTIRKSDNRIGVDAGIPLDNADDATALAAALLAAAAVWTPADTTEVGSHRPRSWGSSPVWRHASRRIAGCRVWRSNRDRHFMARPPHHRRQERP